MSIWKLRLSMVATLAIIFGLSTLVFAVILSLTGTFDLLTLGVVVVVMNIAQWLLAPYLVDLMYRVKPMADTDNPQLHQTVKNLAMKSGISVPKLMLSKIPLPNAFAYGSPLTGNRVAVTEGLLNNLNDGEVEAVIGHELGHLKHRDVQTMMVVSFLPALFYYIGFSLMWAGNTQSGNNKNSGGNSALFGIVFMAFSWVLNFFILYLSRIREYYADRHSVSVVDDGATKLSTGLARIVHTTKRPTRNKQEQKNLNAFKALFIADPDKAAQDSATLSAMEVNGQALVQEILAKKPTLGDRLIEILSTHPNIVKRLQALQELDDSGKA